MTILLIEGFDNASSAADLFAGVLASASATASSSFTVSTATQFGGKCLTVSTNNVLNLASAAYTSMPINTSSANVVMGSSILLSPSGNSGYDIAFTNGMICHIFCRFILNAVSIYRGDPVAGSYTLIGNAITGLVSNGWAYIEIKATIGTGTSGAVSIYVNGNRMVNLTGLNTSNDGTAIINGIALGAYDGSGSGFVASYDNIYVLDTLGLGPNNAVLGPTRVVTRVPSANVTVSFAPLANTNWQEVDETPLDSNASYNSSLGIPSSDTFSAFPLPTTTSEVFAIQVKAAVRKDDAGTRAMTTTIMSTGSPNSGATVALSPAYQYIADIYPLDPHTGSSWTTATVNASTFGYTVVS